MTNQSADELDLEEAARRLISLLERGTAHSVVLAFARSALRAAAYGMRVLHGGNG